MNCRSRIGMSGSFINRTASPAAHRIVDLTAFGEQDWSEEYMGLS
jgi:hypothetical protein